MAYFVLEYVLYTHCIPYSDTGACLAGMQVWCFQTIIPERFGFTLNLNFYEVFNEEERELEVVLTAWTRKTPHRGYKDG